MIGGSTCTAEVAALGEQLGELLAERGCVVVNGGMSGVMEAVARGVRRRDGTCLGVLPGLDRRGAAPDLSLSLLTGMGHARNLAVVASGDVVIALGGSWGTLSEIGLARSIGREVVLLESWTVTPARRASPTASTGRPAPSRPSSSPSPSPTPPTAPDASGRRRSSSAWAWASAMPEPDGEGDGEALGLGAFLVPTSSTSGTIE